MTKYMNGHSDVIMGGIATNREDLYNRLNNIEMGKTRYHLLLR